MSYLSHQNAESGISGTKKLLDTFKMFCQNKPKVIAPFFMGSCDRLLIEG